MANMKLISIVIVLFFKTSMCNNNILYKKVYELNKISVQQYGAMKDKNKEHSKFKIQNMDYLLYPRGDRQKLLILSSLWRDYYECSVHSSNKLTSLRQVPSAIVAVYAGAVARLPCNICVPPNERNSLTWMYAKSTTNMALSPLQDNERTVWDDTLTIYNARAEDAGVYGCQMGSSSSVVLLEVVDDHQYNVVKPSTSRGPYTSPPLSLDNGLTVFSSWSAWSECSVCGRVGRRHRHGMCYVKLDHIVKTNQTNTLDSKHLRLFEVFPGGIPCQSQYLPNTIRVMDGIRQRSNEIMISMCKVPCNDMIFHTRSSNGDTVETANNTAGVYSLVQVLPKQPPLLARDIIFAEFGQQVDIRCPGTTLRDVPIVWHCGTKVIMPRELAKSSGGRMYINSRDHLVITTVLYRDANLYSCWRRGAGSGAVRVRVRRGPGAPPRRAGDLAILLVALALLKALHACKP